MIQLLLATLTNLVGGDRVSLISRGAEPPLPEHPLARGATPVSRRLTCHAPRVQVTHYAYYIYFCYAKAYIILLIVLTIFIRAVNVPNVILEYFYRKYTPQ